MTVPADNTDLLTTAGVGVLGVIGGIAKGAQWRDVKTGKVSWPLLFSGLAVCVVMAAIIRAAGVHYGVEPWVQVAASGVFCYVGPDPIISAIANLALKRFGVGVTTDGQHSVPSDKP